MYVQSSNVTAQVSQQPTSPDQLPLVRRDRKRSLNTLRKNKVRLLVTSSESRWSRDIPHACSSPQLKRPHVNNQSEVSSEEQLVN